MLDTYNGIDTGAAYHNAQAQVDAMRREGQYDPAITAYATQKQREFESQQAYFRFIEDPETFIRAYLDDHPGLATSGKDINQEIARQYGFTYAPNGIVRSVRADDNNNDVRK